MDSEIVCMCSRVNGEDVRLMLWDTARQEEFDAITKAYYRGAQACVLVFSTTVRDSFEAISSWREKVEMEVGDIPTVLVQNKIDLLDDTVIKNEEAEGLAKTLKLRFYRTSVKEDLNVNEGNVPQYIEMLSQTEKAAQAYYLRQREQKPEAVLQIHEPTHDHNQQRLNTSCDRKEATKRGQPSSSKRQAAADVTSDFE
ncbi:ras-related protein Rab-23-like [Megalobrama amblycephala]|uniref:ras-related protein Rab-23-like n=1 Tax=Megalobrama amblycephala TaxID=75352 RepID=UPI002013FDE2|nr:ras-related protein Rab-23-like [Megalobrama amblycephala]